MRRGWTSEEDQKLLELKEQGGSWSLITKKFNSFFHTDKPRSENAITQRYTRSVNPALRKGEWTAEEDGRLLEILADPVMASFSRIANALGTRSDLSVRQHM